jgi:hypothetical protein
LAYYSHVSAHCHADGCSISYTPRWYLSMAAGSRCGQSCLCWCWSASAQQLCRPPCIVRRVSRGRQLGARACPPRSLLETALFPPPAATRLRSSALMVAFCLLDLCESQLSCAATPRSSRLSQTNPCVCRPVRAPWMRSHRLQPTCPVVGWLP